MSKKPDDDFQERVERLERVIYGPNEDALRRIDRENLDLGSFVRLYTGPPNVADLESRSSIREDTVIRELSRLLSDRLDGEVSVVDACCGEASLARRVIASISTTAAKRIRYWAVDQNHICIGNIRARRDDFGAFNEFRFLQRQVWDLGDIAPHSVDLIVLNNALHEIPPHIYPDLFRRLNLLLHQQYGRICIVDMETLPDEVPESIAITWRGKEVEQFLCAASFSLELTIHPKATNVYQAHVKHAPNGVDEHRMILEIEELIRSKMSHAIQTR